MFNFLRNSNPETRSQIYFAAPMALSAGIFFGMILTPVSWWLKGQGISISIIVAIESVLSAAYAFRFLWIPFFDMFSFNNILHKLGMHKISAHRSGWILSLTYVSCGFIFLASMIPPTFKQTASINPLFVILLCASAFFMATADSLMVAYNCETLKADDMSISAAAYRIGAFSSAGLATILQEQFNISWPMIFRVLSIIIACLISTLLFADPDADIKQKSANDAFIGPLVNLKTRFSDLSKSINWIFSAWSFAPLIMVTLFILTYKAQDRLCMPMDKFFATSKTACNFSRTQYSLMQTISKPLLPAAMLLTGTLIRAYDYKYAFIMIILIDALMPLMYCLYSFARLSSNVGSMLSPMIMIVCITVSLAIGIFILLKKPKTPSSINSSLAKSNENRINYRSLIMSLITGCFITMVCVEIVHTRDYPEHAKIQGDRTYIGSSPYNARVALSHIDRNKLYVSIILSIVLITIIKTILSVFIKKNVLLVWNLLLILFFATFPPRALIYYIITYISQYFPLHTYLNGTSLAFEYMSLPMIAGISIITINKIVSAIKASILYNYQRDLASPQYILQQMTLMNSADKLFGLILGSLSGVLQARLGWDLFYVVALIAALLPLVVIFIGPMFNKALLKQAPVAAQEDTVVNLSEDAALAPSG
jgi:hypothetical protein